MSASVLVFIFNDALIKLAAEGMPSIQAIGLRGIFATGWCLVALLATGAWRQIGGLAHRQVMLRGALEAAAAITYLVALFHIPFASATAINMSTPLMLTILAVLILKEDVRWRRWLAIAVGFVGVLMVIQPRPDDLNAWTWVVVGASLLGALRDVTGRFLPANVPTLVVSLSSAVCVALVGCVWALAEGWQPVGRREVLLLLASSFLLASGYQFLVLALRTGAEMSLIGSFRYASVLWAIAIGFVVWGEIPNKLAVAGIVVVVGSGLYILRREKVRGLSHETLRRDER